MRSSSDSPSEALVEKQVMATPSVRIEDLPGMAYEPLIDEPVTGSGNDDLWAPDCDPTKQTPCPVREGPPAKL